VSASRRCAMRLPGTPSNASKENLAPSRPALPMPSASAGTRQSDCGNDARARHQNSGRRGASGGWMWRARRPQRLTHDPGRAASALRWRAACTRASHRARRAATGGPSARLRAGAQCGSRYAAFRCTGRDERAERRGPPVVARRAPHDDERPAAGDSATRLERRLDLGCGEPCQPSSTAVLLLNLNVLPRAIG
jgi:hypothetical protein